jgi:hypothetical protein
MLSNSFHLLQPLDVSCFLVLKRTYRLLVQEKMRVRISYIDKDDFLELYLQACTTTFTSTSIQSGFKATRLASFNPDKVLEQLYIRLRTLSLPYLIAPS